MRKAAYAEGLISCFAPPERARSIAGDLTEEAAYRGNVWFATSLAGVVAALFLGAFATARAYTLWLMLRGFVVWAIVYAAVRVAGLLSGIEPDFVPGTPFEDLPLTAQAYLAGTLIVAGAAAGAVLGASGNGFTGKGATGNGLNAATPLAMLWLSLAVVAPLWDVATGTATWSCTFFYIAGLPLCYALPLLGGALCTARVAAPAQREAAG